MSTPRAEVVAFDLMDTLVHDPYREALTAAFGDQIQAAFAGRDRTTWPRFETGEITEDEFWEAHAQWSPDLAAFDRVRRAQTTWLPGMRELLLDVRDGGHRVLIASNYPSWMIDLEERLLSGLVDEVVVSYRIGARKPDPAFYAAVVAAAGVPAGNIVLVDDRDENVAGATATGMHGITHRETSTTRAHLADLGVL